MSHQKPSVHQLFGRSTASISMSVHEGHVELSTLGDARRTRQGHFGKGIEGRYEER